MKTTPPSPQPRSAMICVADVDLRLVCGGVCVTCQHYMQDRRHDERRDKPRRTHDRRVLDRAV